MGVKTSESRMKYYSQYRVSRNLVGINFYCPKIKRDERCISQSATLCSNLLFRYVFILQHTMQKRGCAYFDTSSFRFLQEFSQPSFEARLLLLAFFSSELFPESLLSVTSISLRSLSKNLYSRNARA